MVPDFGGLIWMIIALLEAIIFVAAALAFVFWLMPPIARKFIRAKFSKRSVAFIQHAGKVRLCMTKAELPEGVIENEFGWFLKSTMPYKGKDEPEKRGPGRPHKKAEDSVQAFKEQIIEKGGEKAWEVIAPFVLAASSDEDINRALDIALETPILEGLNKHVLFGSSDTALLGNLNTITALSQDREKFGGHAILNAIKTVIPATMSRTQIDAIATLNYLRGLKVRGGDMMKLLIVVVAVIGVIGSIGLVFWFLTQGGK
jgi:hypothetical protein